MSRRGTTPLIEGTAPIRSAGDDRYGRSGFAEVLAKIVEAQKGFGLLVIGVDGAWGAGKSSTLALAVERLTSKRRHREVVVSAWRSTTQDQFLANLSFSIATALRRDWQSASWRIAWAKLKRQSLPMVLAILTPLLTVAAIILFPEVRGWTKTITKADPKKLAEGIGLFGLPIIGFVFSKLSKPFAEGFATLLGRTTPDGVGSLELFAYDFDVLSAAQPAGSRFVVLVEDLDRCKPTHVTDVLSAIAQLSAHPRADRLAFLLAYDRAVILDSIAADAVEHVGGDDAIKAAAAEDYLNRVVQIELPLPDADAAVTSKETFCRIPQVPTVLRGFVISLLVVSCGVAHLAAYPTNERAGCAFAIMLLLVVVDLVIGQLRKLRDGYTEPEDWSEAARDIEKWLVGEPRRRVRVRNLAKVALLMRDGCGIDSWEALSITALADRWPGGFDIGSLTEAGDGPINPSTDYREAGVAEAIRQMGDEGLPVDQFRDPKKVLAIVSTFRR